MKCEHSGIQPIHNIKLIKPTVISNVKTNKKEVMKRKMNLNHII